MDYSLVRAGRTTHFKIVGVALVCAIAVILVGVNAKIAGIESARVQTGAAVVKAGQPAAYADKKVVIIR